jgi:hypothetical protein
MKDREMNFNGGVIIVGSLLWENSPKRHKWRQLYLDSIDKGIAAQVKIRYGRQSSTRHDTFTMIISQHPTTEFGQALIIPFKETIKNSLQLENQAFALAAAEGLWTDEGRSLNKSWGTVGLLINPSIDVKDRKNADVVRGRWTKLYSEYKLDNTKYTIDKEEPPIDKNGFLQLEWTNEMNQFDFLLATAVVPKPRTILTAKQIADKMKEKNYREYFDNNQKNNIRTFQDVEIERELS